MSLFGKLLGNSPSGGAGIGSLISGATEGSVLFAGAAGVLAQDNTYFKIAGTGADKVLTVGYSSFQTSSGTGACLWGASTYNLSISCGGGGIYWNGGVDGIRVAALNSSSVPLRVNLKAAQTADAFQVYTSGAYLLFRIDANGNVYGDNAFIGGVFSANGQGFRSESTGDRLDPSVAGQFSLKRYSTNLILSFLGAGAAVASATALPTPTGRIFHVTGTTNITSITSTAIGAGCIITLVFDGVLTVTDGNNLKLAGDFITTADDTLTLGYDGTNWYEIARSAN